MNDVTNEFLNLNIQNGQKKLQNSDQNQINNSNLNAIGNTENNNDGYEGIPLEPLNFSNDGGEISESSTPSESAQSAQGEISESTTSNDESAQDEISKSNDQSFPDIQRETEALNYKRKVGLDRGHIRKDTAYENTINARLSNQLYKLDYDSKIRDIKQEEKLKNDNAYVGYLVDTLIANTKSMMSYDVALRKSEFNALRDAGYDKNIIDKWEESTELLAYFDSFAQNSTFAALDAIKKFYANRTASNIKIAKLNNAYDTAKQKAKLILEAKQKIYGHEMESYAAFDTIVDVSTQLGFLQSFMTNDYTKMGTYKKEYSWDIIGGAGNLIWDIVKSVASGAVDTFYEVGNRRGFISNEEYDQRLLNKAIENWIKKDQYSMLTFKEQMQYGQYTDFLSTIPWYARDSLVFMAPMFIPYGFGAKLLNIGIKASAAMGRGARAANIVGRSAESLTRLEKIAIASKDAKLIKQLGLSDSIVGEAFEKGMITLGYKLGYKAPFLATATALNMGITSNFLKAQKYQTLREHGFSHDKAADASRVLTNGETALAATWNILGLLGLETTLGFAFKPITKIGLVDAFASKLAASKLGIGSKFLGGVGATFIAEGLTEGAQQMIEDYISYNHPEIIDELNLWDSWVSGATIGAFTGGFTAGVGRGVKTALKGAGNIITNKNNSDLQANPISNLVLNPNVDHVDISSNTVRNRKKTTDKFFDAIIKGIKNRNNLTEEQKTSRTNRVEQVRQTFNTFTENITQGLTHTISQIQTKLTSESLYDETNGTIARQQRRIQENRQRNLNTNADQSNIPVYNDNYINSGEKLTDDLLDTAITNLDSNEDLRKRIENGNMEEKAKKSISNRFKDKNGNVRINNLIEAKKAIKDAEETIAKVNDDIAEGKTISDEQLQEYVEAVLLLNTFDSSILNSINTLIKNSKAAKRLFDVVLEKKSDWLSNATEEQTREILSKIIDMVNDPNITWRDLDVFLNKELGFDEFKKKQEEEEAKKQEEKNKENKTEENKTEENKTEENKTEENKEKESKEDASRREENVQIVNDVVESISEPTPAEKLELLRKKQQKAITKKQLTYNNLLSTILKLKNIVFKQTIGKISKLFSDTIQKIDFDNTLDKKWGTDNTFLVSFLNILFNNTTNFSKTFFQDLKPILDVASDIASKELEQLLKEAKNTSEQISSIEDLIIHGSKQQKAKALEILGRAISTALIKNPNVKEHLSHIFGFNSFAEMCEANPEFTALYEANVNDNSDLFDFLNWLQQADLQRMENNLEPQFNKFYQSEYYTMLMNALALQIQATKAITSNNIDQNTYNPLTELQTKLNELIEKHNQINRNTLVVGNFGALPIIFGSLTEEQNVTNSRTNTTNSITSQETTQRQEETTPQEETQQTESKTEEVTSQEETTPQVEETTPQVETQQTEANVEKTTTPEQSNQNQRNVSLKEYDGEQHIDTQGYKSHPMLAKVKQHLKKKFSNFRNKLKEATNKFNNIKAIRTNWQKFRAEVIGAPFSYSVLGDERNNNIHKLEQGESIVSASFYVYLMSTDEDIYNALTEEERFEYFQIIRDTALHNRLAEEFVHDFMQEEEGTALDKRKRIEEDEKWKKEFKKYEEDRSPTDEQLKHYASDFKNLNNTLPTDSKVVSKFRRKTAEQNSNNTSSSNKKSEPITRSEAELNKAIKETTDIVVDEFLESFYPTSTNKTKNTNSRSNSTEATLFDPDNVDYIDKGYNASDVNLENQHSFNPTSKAHSQNIADKLNDRLAANGLNKSITSQDIIDAFNNANNKKHQQALKNNPKAKKSAVKYSTNMNEQEKKEFADIVNNLIADHIRKQLTTEILETKFKNKLNTSATNKGNLNTNIDTDTNTNTNIDTDTEQITSEEALIQEKLNSLLNTNKDKKLSDIVKNSRSSFFLPSFYNIIYNTYQKIKDAILAPEYAKIDEKIKDPKKAKEQKDKLRKEYQLPFQEANNYLIKNSTQLKNLSLGEKMLFKLYAKKLAKQTNTLFTQIQELEKDLGKNTNVDTAYNLLSTLYNRIQNYFDILLSDITLTSEEHKIVLELLHNDVNTYVEQIVEQLNLLRKQGDHKNVAKLFSVLKQLRNDIQSINEAQLIISEKQRRAEKVKLTEQPITLQNIKEKLMKVVATLFTRVLPSIFNNKVSLHNKITAQVKNILDTFDSKIEHIEYELLSDDINTLNINISELNKINLNVDKQYLLRVRRKYAFWGLDDRAFWSMAVSTCRTLAQSNLINRLALLLEQEELNKITAYFNHQQLNGKFVTEEELAPIIDKVQHFFEIITPIAIDALYTLQAPTNYFTENTRQGLKNRQYKKYDTRALASTIVSLLLNTHIDEHFQENANTKEDFQEDENIEDITDNKTEQDSILSANRGILEEIVGALAITALTSFDFRNRNTQFRFANNMEESNQQGINSPVRFVRYNKTTNTISAVDQVDSNNQVNKVEETNILLVEPTILASRGFKDLDEQKNVVPVKFPPTTSPNHSNPIKQAMSAPEFEINPNAIEVANELGIKFDENSIEILSESGYEDMKADIENYIRDPLKANQQKYISAIEDYLMTLALNIETQDSDGNIYTKTMYIKINESNLRSTIFKFINYTSTNTQKFLDATNYQIVKAQLEAFRSRSKTFIQVAMVNEQFSNKTNSSNFNDNLFAPIEETSVDSEEKKANQNIFKSIFDSMPFNGKFHFDYKIGNTFRAYITNMSASWSPTNSKVFRGLFRNSSLQDIDNDLIIVDKDGNVSINQEKYNKLKFVDRLKFHTRRRILTSSSIDQNLLEDGLEKNVTQRQLFSIALAFLTGIDPDKTPQKLDSSRSDIVLTIGDETILANELINLIMSKDKRAIDLVQKMKQQTLNQIAKEGYEDPFLILAGINEILKYLTNDNKHFIDLGQIILKVDGKTTGYAVASIVLQDFLNTTIRQFSSMAEQENMKDAYTQVAEGFDSLYELSEHYKSEFPIPVKLIIDFIHHLPDQKRDIAKKIATPVMYLGGYPTGLMGAYNELIYDELIDILLFNNTLTNKKTNQQYRTLNYITSLKFKSSKMLATQLRQLFEDSGDRKFLGLICDDLALELFKSGLIRNTDGTYSISKEKYINATMNYLDKNNFNSKYKAKVTKFFNQTLYSLTKNNNYKNELSLPIGDLIFTPFSTNRQILNDLNTYQQSVIQNAIFAAFMDNEFIRTHLFEFYTRKEKETDSSDPNVRQWTLVPKQLFNITREQQVIATELNDTMNKIIDDTFRKLQLNVKAKDITLSPKFRQSNNSYTKKTKRVSEYFVIDSTPLKSVPVASNFNNSSGRNYVGNAVISNPRYFGLSVPILFGHTGESYALTQVYRDNQHSVCGSAYDGIFTSSDSLFNVLQNWNTSLQDFYQANVLMEYYKTLGEIELNTINTLNKIKSDNKNNAELIANIDTMSEMMENNGTKLSEKSRHEILLNLYSLITDQVNAYKNALEQVKTQNRTQNSVKLQNMFAHNINAESVLTLEQMYKNMSELQKSFRKMFFKNENVDINPLIVEQHNQRQNEIDAVVNSNRLRNLTNNTNINTDIDTNVDTQQDINETNSNDLRSPLEASFLFNDTGYSSLDTQSNFRQQMDEAETVDLDELISNLETKLNNAKSIAEKATMKVLVDGLKKIRKLKGLNVKIKRMRESQAGASINGITRTYRTSRVAAEVLFGHMANEEVMAHELIHLFTETAITNRGTDAKIDRILTQIETVYSQVIDKLFKQFGDATNISKAMGWDLATFNYITSPESGVSEFIAYFLTNEKARAWLSKQTFEQTLDQNKQATLKNQNLFMKLLTYFKNLCAGLIGKLDGEFIGEAGDVVLAALVEQLAVRNNLYLEAKAVYQGLITQEETGIEGSLNKELNNIIDQFTARETNQLKEMNDLITFQRKYNGRLHFSPFSAIYRIATLPFFYESRVEATIVMSQFINMLDNAESAKIRWFGRMLRQLALDLNAKIHTSEFSARAIEVMSYAAGIKNHSQGLAQRFQLNMIKKVGDLYEEYSIPQTKTTEEMLGVNIVTYRLNDVIRFSTTSQMTNETIKQDMDDFYSMLFSDNIETIRRNEKELSTLLSREGLTRYEQRLYFRLLKNFSMHDMAYGKVYGYNATGIKNYESFLVTLKNTFGAEFRIEPIKYLIQDENVRNQVQKLSALYAMRILRETKDPDFKKLAEWVKDENSNERKFLNNIMHIARRQDHDHIVNNLHAGYRTALYSDFQSGYAKNQRTDVKKILTYEDYLNHNSLGYKLLEWNKSKNTYDELTAILSEDEFNQLIRKNKLGIYVRRNSIAPYRENTLNILYDHTAQGLIYDETFADYNPNYNTERQILETLKEEVEFNKIDNLLFNARDEILQSYFSTPNTKLIKETLNIGYMLTNYSSYIRVRPILSKKEIKELYQSNSSLSAMLGAKEYNSQITKTNYKIRMELMESIININKLAQKEMRYNPTVRNSTLKLFEFKEVPYIQSDGQQATTTEIEYLDVNKLKLFENPEFQNLNSKKRNKINYMVLSGIFTTQGLEHLVNRAKQEKLNEIYITQDMWDIMNTQMNKNIVSSKTKNKLRKDMPLLYKSMSYITFWLNKVLNDLKANIIIRNEQVVAMNASSNLISLYGFGVSAKDILYWTKKGLGELQVYENLLTNKKELEFEILQETELGNQTKVDKLKHRLKRINNELDTNEIKELLEYGFYANIMTDANTNALDTQAITATLDKAGITGTNRKIAEWIANHYLFTPKDIRYITGEFINNTSDFVARYVAYKHYLKTLPKRKAMEKAQDMFINYNRPLMSPLFRLSEFTGISGFAKYRLGIQGALFRAVADNPLKGMGSFAFTFMVLPHSMMGLTVFSSVLDNPFNLFLTRVQNPFNLMNPLGRRGNDIGTSLPFSS